MHHTRSFFHLINPSFCNKLPIIILALEPLGDLFNLKTLTFSNLFPHFDTLLRHFKSGHDSVSAKKRSET